MNVKHTKNAAGFSLIELLVAMAVVLMLLGLTSGLLYRALGVRAWESRRTDALTSAQAALNVMSREISNSGFGIYDDAITENPNNGLILEDSTDEQIHFRANLTNFGPGPVNSSCPAVCTDDPGEDITYFFDNATKSIVRFDPRGDNGNPQTSVIVNRISGVRFRYYDYAANGTVTGPNNLPSRATGRIEIEVHVDLERVHGQPFPASVRFISEVNLRNSDYMLRQY